MPSGIEMKNTSGSFQVTQETRVLAYLRKGSKNSSAYNSISRRGCIKIPMNESTEVVAISCTKKCSVLFHDGTNLVIGVDTPAGTSINVRYWVFGRPTTTTRTGIQVFDGNGTSASNLLYDSSWKPMKPVAIATGSSKTMPSGKTYAVLPISFRSSMYKELSEIRNPTGQSDLIYILERKDYGCSVNGRTIAIGEYLGSAENKTRHNIQGAGYAYKYTNDNQAPNQYLVIDVTGL